MLPEYLATHLPKFEYSQITKIYAKPFLEMIKIAMDNSMSCPEPEEPLWSEMKMNRRNSLAKDNNCNPNLFNKNYIITQFFVKDENKNILFIRLLILI